MPAEAEVKFENPDVAASKLALLAFGFLAFVAISLILLLAYFRYFDRGGMASAPETFPAPRLETRNAENLDDLVGPQRRLLESYASVDPQKQLVRVPITRAMELIAARGGGAYGPIDAPPPSDKNAP
ncbi:MAG: hypothetical protein JO105_22575 [Hyphomicrobiales bacterium]|nr:hypothetical protein [Hyphomicrobiales bacterium]MBV9978180.1 hypothetical protein [Hyphomicrobiales bacterium]